MGPLSPLSDLVYGDFDVKLLANDLVALCESKNTFINSGASKDRQQRNSSNTFTFQTPKSGEEVEPMTV
jgi:hypothetical protein